MILKKGDEIRVLVLSESMGFKVTFCKHVFEWDDFYGYLY